MIGATIGAGVGPFQGLHGLIIDALRSVRIVTADGDVVTASETVNEGLFWAVRGAGANFGVIVSATYEIYDAPNNAQLILADFGFNGSVNASLFRLLQSWDKTYPKEMGLTLSAALNKTTFEVCVCHLQVLSWKIY
jgi:FAD/FMN-containing dehydrogenase